MNEFFVGIDIAKKSFAVAIMNKEGKLLRTLNAKMKKESLLNLLAELKSLGDPKKILIGIESSGNYHINIFYFLTQNGYSVVIINPLIVHKFARVSLRKCKTDNKDAYLIAKILISEQTSIASVSYNWELREIARIRESICYKVATLKTQIKQLMHTLFPELEERVYLFSNSILNLLLKYPSAYSISNVNEEEIEHLLKQYSKGRARIKAKEIINLAKNSIGIRNEGLEFVLIMRISMFLVAYDNLKKTTQALLRMAKLIFPKEMEILTSIKGINSITAAHFLAEIASIFNFTHYKKLIAYAGVDPTVYESGKYKGKSKISKTGNKHLRRVLWIMANNVVFKNEYFKSYFEKKRSEGLPYKKAIMCVVHKLIRIVWAMLQKGSHFIPPHRL